MPTLYDPLQVGDLLVSNRVFMAPLTRARSDAVSRVPGALVAQYYAQRSRLSTRAWACGAPDASACIWRHAAMPHTMGDSAPRELFLHVARELGARRLAFLSAREHAGPDRLGPQLREAFGGTFVANEGFDGTGASADLAEGRSDAVAFGRLFIANPDLPDRLRRGEALNTPDPATFYTPGAGGYIDYPSLAASAPAGLAA